ncbi:hypothetical protein JMX53_05595 [Cutibacterium avidum]|nr:hypothetical protein [Cutibacterium avidum]QQY15973.1 hypothetical protein JMX53_05595 [Cutibacterium avidum]
MTEHENKFTPDNIVQNGADTTGESINAGFPGVHVENWTAPHLHHRGR